MVHHIVLWNWKEGLAEAEKKEAAAKIKEKLEGVVSLEVITDSLSSGNKDIGLVSVFESEEALGAYQTHPAHVEAGNYIKGVTTGRTCLDFKEKK
jgi:heme-degrading monooxygenase HmoA